MKKKLLYLFPVLLLILFIMIMLGGPFLKKPIYETDDVLKYLLLVQKDIQHNNWELAKKNSHKLYTAWKKVQSRIQFSSERDEMNGINVSIARLKGFVAAKEEGGALAEIYEIHEHWIDLAR